MAEVKSVKRKVFRTERGKNSKSVNDQVCSPAVYIDIAPLPAFLFDFLVALSDLCRNVDFFEKQMFGHVAYGLCESWFRANFKLE